MAVNRPPLRDIETFVLAARALSITKAAEQLGVTTSAASRRIGDLEAELGVDLFTRHNRRIELTPAGRKYLEGVGGALDRIRSETAAAREAHSVRRIRVSTLPVFASTWLLPALAKFREAHPEIDVELETGPELVDFSARGIHASIRFGAGEWPGLVAERLMNVALNPVCAPSLVAPPGAPTPAVLDRYVFLSLDVPLPLWAEWFASVGLEGFAPRRMRVYDSGLVMYEAAAAGMGLALGAKPLITSYLTSGRLRNAFATPPARSRFGYHLVYRDRDRHWPPLRAFRRLLVAEAAATASD